MTAAEEPVLYVPVLLGTARQGRMSLPAARLVVSELEKRAGIETELIELGALPASAEDLAARMARADGLVIVSPEHNPSLGDFLRHLLGGSLHKAAGLVGVSAGTFDGARGLQSLVPVLRELGLVTTTTDLYIATVQSAFDAAGALKDPALLPRLTAFVTEMVWMTRTLRWGRDSDPRLRLGSGRSPE